MNAAIMAREIGEQPDVLRRIEEEGRGPIERVAGAVRRRQPRFVLFVARGTSDHAALYAKYLVETRLGLPAGLVSPSTATVYNAFPYLRDVLFVGISQSGSSPDLIEPMIRARGAGAITVAVTNAPDSPLAQSAEFHVDVLAGREEAVAATKTYTAQLLTLYLFVDALVGDERADVGALPDQARDVLGCGDAVALLATRYRFADQIVVISRGYNYPTAREAALKLMETSYLVAHGFSAADLLHGPMAMIDRGFPVIVVLPPGDGGLSLRPVTDQLARLGADTLVIGEGEACGVGTVGLSLPPLGQEILSPILTILPLQQLALHLALQRGNDPDRPRGLTKITETW
ncbi:MAG: SIS domain-containing protein [Chloroflexota bacterium]